jgi:hypothetical protein
MGMPAGNSGMAGPAPDANSGAGFEGGNANICADDGEADANICVDGDRQTANFDANGGEVFLAGTTATTTEESESFGGGTGNRPSGENLRPDENLRSGENFRANPSLSVAEPPAWVTLGAELLETLGIRRPLAITEAVLVRGWFEKGATPEILRGVFHTVMGRGTCPSNPALSYFDGPVLDMLGAGNRAPASTAASRSEPAAEGGEETPRRAREVSETPEASVEWASDTPERAALAAAWAKIRARLQDEVGDAEYRNWLRPMTLRGVDGDEVLISLPSSFVRDWVRDHHGVRVTALWQAEHPSIRRVEFCLGDTGRGPPHAAPKDDEAPRGLVATPEPITTISPAPSAQSLADGILKDRLTAVFEKSRERDVPGAGQSPLLDAFRQASGDPVAERAANEWLDRMEAWHRVEPDFETCPAPFPTWMEGRERLRLV